MNEFSIIIYDGSHFEEWNNFIAKAKNATFLFHRDFMEYHRDRFNDYSLMVYKRDVLVAVLPATVEKDVVTSHAGLTYGGLICASNIRSQTFFDAFAKVLEFLEQRQISNLEIKVIPKIYNTDFADELEYIAFVTDAALMRRDLLSVVNLAKPISFVNNKKSEIKKAIKNQLTVLETDDMRDFWEQILVPNLQRKYQKLPVHTLEEIRTLKGFFSNQIRQFNVYSDRIIGGATVFVTETTAHVQYISGLDNYNNLGGLDLLHAHLIENVFADKQFFDFGISNVEEGRKLNKGLLYWKEGFGARAVVQNFYRIKTTNHLKLKQLWI